MVRFAVLAMFGLGCGAAPVSHPNEPAPVPIAAAERLAPPGAVVFHADTEFLPSERVEIALAISALAVQTGGLYRPSVVYDVNFWDTGSIIRSKDVPTLVRAESTYAWIMVQDFRRGVSLMGITFYGGSPPSTFLVIDRLVAEDFLQHVTMHELLHAAGLRDLVGRGSVMSGSLCDARGCNPVLCMTDADADEACRVWRCDPSELRVCGTSHPTKAGQK